MQNYNKVIMKEAVDMKLGDITLHWKQGYYNQELKTVHLSYWLNGLKRTAFTAQDKPNAPKLFPQKDITNNGYSGIICLDFDKIGAENLDVLIQKLKESPYIFAGGSTISGNGAWAFAVTKITGDKKTDKEIYIAAKMFFEKEFGHKLDDMMTSPMFGRTAAYDERYHFCKDISNITIKTLNWEVKRVIKNEDRKIIDCRIFDGKGKNYMDKVFCSLRNNDEGSRNNALFKAAACLANKIKTDNFDERYAINGLTKTATELGLSEIEINRTLKSAGII